MRKCALLSTGRRLNWEEAGPVYLLMERTRAGNTSC